ncbi:MAG: hypothetical protein J6D52_13395 [Clostridia bacterium]|nr:hypothetical protein [Clostridia bacterium]
MLNEYTGYLFGVLSAFITLPIYIYKTKNQDYIIGRCVLVLLLIFYGTLYITDILFPLPIQSSVIQSGFHEKENYIIPFSELRRLYEYNVTIGKMSLEIFVKEYLIAVWNMCSKIIPIGLFVKLIFRYKFKRYILFSVFWVFFFEMVKLLCNLITTVNYISFVAEHLLYSFISLLLGFCLYYPIFWIATKLRNSSNIMSGIYQLLKQ